MAESGRDRGVGGLVLVASLVVLVAGLKAAGPLVIPFLLSLFLAMLSLPLLQWMLRRGLLTTVAVFATIMVDLVVLAGIVVLVAGSFRDFTAAAPRYQARLVEMQGVTVEWLRAHGVDASRWITTDLVNPGSVLEMVGTMLSGIAGVLSNAVFVVLFMVLILFEAVGFPAKLHTAFGGQRGVLDQFTRVKNDVQRYLGVKALISLLTGGLIAGALALLGVDFPLLWGLVAFILNYIPNLGSILAAVPTILLALVEYGPGKALVVALVYLAVNALLGNVVEPLLLGRQFKLSTLVVFVSMVFWGWIWGPVGMLLSVPLTMIVKISLEASQELRWIAVLLEPGSAEPGGLPEVR
jgi:predicted PurR-regulated permease PerM